MAQTVLLAIETSGQVSSACLVVDEQLYGLRRGSPKSKHGEFIFEAIADLLAEAGIGAKEITHMACAIGPGSFTGLRTGLGALKGLALSTGAAIIPVSTLAAAASCYPHHSQVIVPILDARKGQVYAGAYSVKEHAAENLLEDGVFDPSDLAKRLADLKRDLLLVGPGVREYRTELHALPHSTIIEDHELHPVPSALGVARMAAAALRRGAFADAASLSPNYLRGSGADLPSSRAIPVPGALPPTKT